MARVTIACLLLLSVPAASMAQQPPATSVAERTAGLQRADGFVPFYWDAARGRVLMEIPAFDEDVLYYVSAASGIVVIGAPGASAAGACEPVAARIVSLQGQVEVRAAGSVAWSVAA
jgi:hypothetical protein